MNLDVAESFTQRHKHGLDLSLRVMSLGSATQDHISGVDRCCSIMDAQRLRCYIALCDTIAQGVVSRWELWVIEPASPTTGTQDCGRPIVHGVVHLGCLILMMVVRATEHLCH